LTYWLAWLSAVVDSFFSIVSAANLLIVEAVKAAIVGAVIVKAFTILDRIAKRRAKV
jgi:hypothetical protein